MPDEKRDQDLAQELHRVIREMTEIAKVLKMFDSIAARDPVHAELPLIEPVNPGPLGEISAVVNMFNVTTHVFQRHFLALQSLVRDTGYRARPAVREVTMLSCSLHDVAKTLRRVEPEDAVRSVERLTAFISSIAADNHGEFTDLDGGSFEVLFGLRSRHRAHAVDACTCALELLTGLDQFNHFQTRAHQKPVRLSMGIHTSEMLIGTYEGVGRKSLAAVGEAGEVAARLRTHAAGRVRPVFVTEAVATEVSGSIMVAPSSDVQVRIGGRETAAYEITHMPPHVDFRDLLERLFEKDADGVE